LISQSDGSPLKKKILKTSNTADSFLFKEILNKSFFLNKKNSIRFQNEIFFMKTRFSK